MFFKQEFENLTTAAYYSDFIKSERPHALIDVRTAEEFRAGHLPDAINIPLDVLRQRLNDIPVNLPVVVVCATGNRSQTGASQLRSAGFSEVFNLQGGTLGWMRQGFQTVR